MCNPAYECDTVMVSLDWSVFSLVVVMAIDVDSVVSPGGVLLFEVVC